MNLRIGRVLGKEDYVIFAGHDTTYPDWTTIICKVDAYGNLIWSKGLHDNGLNALVPTRLVDIGNGNIVVLGWVQNTWGKNGFVVSLDSAGNMLNQLVIDKAPPRAVMPLGRCCLFAR